MSKFVNTTLDGSSGTDNLEAGLLFPIDLIRHHLNLILGDSIGIEVSAVIYSAAVLEYMSAEILELAGNAAHDLETGGVVVRHHVNLAIRRDQELNAVFDPVNSNGAGGGGSAASGSVSTGDEMDIENPEITAPSTSAAVLQFHPYIEIVLTQVHHGYTILPEALDLINAHLNTFFHRMAREFAALAGAAASITTSGRESVTEAVVAAAVRLLLPGQLAPHAVSEGVKAVSKFNSSQDAHM